MRIFVISLSTSYERRSRIEKQLSANSINFEFFDAIDGKALTQAHQKLIDTKKIASNCPRGMTPGEIGCALSHALLYKKIVDEKIANAIIFEDDISPNPRFTDILSSGTLESSNADLVLLYYSDAWFQRWSKTKILDNFLLLKPINMPKIAAGYYLNNKAAQHLCSIAFPISNKADWPMGVFRKLCIRCIYPQIISHPPVSQNSTLAEERKAQADRYKALNTDSFLRKKLKKIKQYYFVPKHENARIPKFWRKIFGFTVP